MVTTLLTRLASSSPARQLFFTSPAVLAVGRVLLAVLLLADVARRVADLDVWYTNHGLMPNHTMLWAPQARLGWSLFYGVSELHEARFFVALIALVYVGLLVGFKTKPMQALALIAHASLDCRVHFVINGGEIALSVLLVWTLFLPLGEWLSVDALIDKLARSRCVRAPNGALALELDPQRAERFRRPAARFEWAAGALVAQLAVIYFFNWVHKDSAGWREGRVVHDVLHQDRIVTSLGVWARGFVTPQISATLTQLTLAIEATLPLALLWPWHHPTVRRLAVVTGISLHAGFATAMNLGVFSYAMIVAWWFVVPPGDLERLARWLAPKGAAVVFVDERSGWWRWLAHVTLVIDETRVGGPAVTLNTSAVAPSELRERVRREGLLVVRDGRPLRRRQALLELLRHGHALAALALLIGSVGTRFDRAFGLGVDRGPFPLVTAARRLAERWCRRLGQGALAAVTVAFVAQVLIQNRAVPATLKPTAPRWVEWLVEYTHFFQGWGMFAVSPDTDATVVVKALTADGRLVDPLSERASPSSSPALAAITARLDHDEFFCDYLSRIADEPAYHPPLRDWLLAYPQRTGNPNDRLVQFEVIQLTDRTPVMGQSTPTDQRQRVVLRWP